MDGSDEDFEWVSSGQEVDDFEGVSDDSDSLDFFTGVSAVELECTDESFYDGGKSLSEFFSLISAGGVGYEDLRSGGLDGNVVLETWIINLNRKRGTWKSS